MCNERRYGTFQPDAGAVVPVPSTPLDHPHLIHSPIPGRQRRELNNLRDQAEKQDRTTCLSGAEASTRVKIIIPLPIFANVTGIILLGIELLPDAGGVDVFVPLVPSPIHHFR